MKTGKAAAAAAGYTYFGLLLAVLAASLVVSAGATLLGNEMRRDKEAELLFAGDEIRRALEIYHAKNSAGTQPFPRTLDALLRDPNQPSIQRYLRKIYRDPMYDADSPGASTEGGTWVLIRDVNGQIVGVHSNSLREPLRKSGFPKAYEAFTQARRYSDWKFLAAGGVPVDARTAGPARPLSFIPTPATPVAPLAAPLVPSPRVAAVPVVPPPPPPLPPGLIEAAAVPLAAPAVPAPAAAAPTAPRAPAVSVAPGTAPAPPVASGTAPAPAVAGAPGAPAAPVAAPGSAPVGAGATPAPAAPGAAPAVAGAPAVAVPAEPSPPSSSPQPFVIRAPSGF